MAEPTTIDLAKLIQTLTASISDLQGQVAVLQQEWLATDSFSGLRGLGHGENHSDHPPRFQKLDFPKYDGKSDPLSFINCCESYFHQQRISAEEQVWMASYNLEAGA
jgi:leucyl aminopeptidase